MRNLTNTLRIIHEDEEGMEAVQVIMIVAIAALVLAALKAAWPTIKSWFSKSTSDIQQGW